jgi:pilus assembly protein Flp/PilA
LSADGRDRAVRKLALAARSFLTAEDGPTAVEYAVMIALILLVCFAAVATVGIGTNSLLQNAASSLP